MLAEVVTEVKQLNKELDRDTESEISDWSAATGPTIGSAGRGRKVSFNRDVSITQYIGTFIFFVGSRSPMRRKQIHWASRDRLSILVFVYGYLYNRPDFPDNPYALWMSMVS